MRKGLIVYGTRPEEIKLFSVWKSLNCEAVCTNQSPDLLQGLIKPDYTTDDIKSLLIEINPKYVVVQGDTRTALYGALAGFERKIPVIHIEAGLRSGDITKPFPEEGYRSMISQIASVHFCSTYNASLNLKDKKNVYLAGQTSLDTLKEFMPEITQGDYAVVTIHRSEADIERIAQELKKIEKLIPLRIFAHPNRCGQYLKQHFVTEAPLNYRDFVKVLAGSRLIISDSGGIQEEAPLLQKPLIIARETTERPEILTTGGAVLAGYNLYKNVKDILKINPKHTHNPFGQGKASLIIKEVLDSLSL